MIARTKRLKDGVNKEYPAGARTPPDIRPAATCRLLLKSLYWRGVVVSGCAGKSYFWLVAEDPVCWELR